MALAEWGKGCGLVLCAFRLSLLGGAMIVLVMLARSFTSLATIGSLLLDRNGL